MPFTLISATKILNFSQRIYTVAEFIRKIKKQGPHHDKCPVAAVKIL